MYEFIKYERAGGVTTITLNRPDVYNALNDEITYELQDAFKIATKDEETRVVVFTGEGFGVVLYSFSNLKNAHFRPRLKSDITP